MDIYFMVIYILLVLSEDIACTFLNQIQIKASEIEQVLYDDNESSVLQCTHRCLLIDKTSIVEYKGTRCRCVKYKHTDDDGMDSTMTGLFVNKPIKTLEKIMPNEGNIDGRIINGGWTNWMNSSCTATCGGGSMKQQRSCTAPKPKYGGSTCIGNENRTVSCNTDPCPIDGGLSNNWVNDGQCSVTCGGGKLDQIKTCTNPVPQHGGKDCNEKPKRKIDCNTQPCPIDGGLSGWKDDGQCSATCGGGELNQIKTCTNPAPQHGGKVCTGNTQQTIDCNMQACPIDGGLSDWKDDGQCSVTCGGGVLNQIKTCTNPAPQHGGKDCTEKPKQTIDCNIQPCPIDGGLSGWKNVGQCSVTCGGGQVTQIRTCTNPAPQHGGKDCTGNTKQTINCNTQPCPIDGGLSGWKNVGQCSVTCGGGQVTQIRTCTNPAPQHGGKDCTGNTKQTINCNTQPCPIDGGLSDWKDDGQCSVICGGGVLNQIKTCTNPAPQHGGKDCAGNTKQTIDCNTQPCPIDGGLSGWKNDGQCSVTCGGGVLNQIKTCTNPAPQHGGKECTGNTKQTVDCNMQACPIDGGWSDWKNDGQCSVTCGGGSVNQIRTCTNPAPQHGGKVCTGKFKKTIACNTPCPIDGGLSEDWVNDGQCPVTCGGAHVNQIKTCTNPAPQHGGKDCTEKPKRTILCNKQACPGCVLVSHSGTCCTSDCYYSTWYLRHVCTDGFYTRNCDP